MQNPYIELLENKAEESYQQAARDTRDGLEPIRQQVRTDIAAEKGAIENCNRLVRRWYPKGTDFNQLTRRQIQQLEDCINSIHRESLNGETAYAYDSRLAKAA